MNRNQLNWRPVQAPDFSASIQGLQTAGNFLNQGFGAASKLLETTDQNLSDRVSKALMAQVAGISESEGAADQIKALMAGVDPRRISEDALMFAADRESTLLGRDKTRLDVQNTKNTMAEREAFNRAAPIWAKAKELARAGNIDGANALLEEGRKNGAFTGVGGKDLLEAGDGIFGARKDFQDYRGAEASYAESQYGFGRRKLTDQQSDSVARVMADIRAKGLVTVEDASRYVMSLGLDPRVQNEVMGQVNPLQFVNPNAMGGAAGGGGGVDTSGGSFSGNPMSIVNYEARGRGFTAVPDNIKTLGQLESWGKQAVAGTGGKGSSASGPYQITYSTFQEFGEKALGKDWRSAESNFETHDKVAQKIFESARGSNEALRGRWAAFKNMSDAEVAAVRAMPWEEASQVIARLESNTDPRAMREMQTAGVVGRANALNQVTGNPVVESWYKAIGQANSVPAVAARLSGEGGVFAGADQKVIEQRLQEITAQVRNASAKAGKPLALNPDQAAALLESSLGKRSWTDFFSDNTWGAGGSIGGRSIDEDHLKANIDTLISGAAERQKLGQGRAANIEAETAAAQAAYERQAAYVASIRAAGGSPAIVARETEKLKRLEAQIGAGIQQQYADGDIVSFGGSNQTAVLVPTFRPAPVKWNGLGAIQLPQRPAGTQPLMTFSPTKSKSKSTSESVNRYLNLFAK